MNRRQRFLAAGLVTWMLVASSPAPASSQAPHRLSLREAIERGLRANLQVLTAGTRVQEAEGTRRRRLAALLPRARGQSLAILQNRSLKAFGIDVPGAPEVVGPFANYDFRIYVDQPVLDLASYRRWKASARLEQAARHDYQDVRDLIVRLVSDLYLTAQAAGARVEAAETRVATSSALVELARAQREAGVATGVDLLRAQVSLANEQQRLLEMRNGRRQSLLLLARAIGMNLGTPLELAEPLELSLIAVPSLPDAIATALAARPDYLALQARRQAAVQERRAVRARYLPQISLRANYGALGRTVGDVKGTGAVEGAISVTLFNRDRDGQALELNSRLQRLDHELADLRVGVEQEIREALLNLESSAAEANVAQQGRDLARRELELARDRFEAGVTNNIEVTTAQDSLARAHENYIVALTRYADAKFALARALGGTETTFDRFMGKP